MGLIDLANPTRFLSFAERVMPWLMAATLFAFAVGLGQALFVAPDDYQQGATVKIMFIHVPSAWRGMFCWGLMSAAALGTLVWRHPLADVAAKTAGGADRCRAPRSSACSPARCGAGRCGAPTGNGTRGSRRCW